MFVIHKADYALRAVKYLAALPKSQYATIASIADAEAIPPAYLAKITTELSRSGFLDSCHGRGGGLRLSQDPKDISFLDVIELIDEPVYANLCTKGNSCNCNKSTACPMRDFWMAQEKSVKKALAKQTFARYRRADKSR